MTQRYNLGPNHIRFFFLPGSATYTEITSLSVHTHTHTQRKSLGKSMIMIFFSVSIFSFHSPPSGLCCEFLAPEVRSPTNITRTRPPDATARHTVQWGGTSEITKGYRQRLQPTRGINLWRAASTRS